MPSPALLPARSNSRMRTAAASIAAGIAAAVLTLGVSTTIDVYSATAADSSAKTVTAAEQDADVANAPFPGLKLTVSQTTGLVSQAVTVSWTGGKLSTLPSSQSGGENFLQIMQCWGDEPGVVPARPDRTTCQYGGFGTTASMRDNQRTPGTVATDDSKYTAFSAEGRSDYTSIPFRPATGDADTIASVVDGKFVPGVDVNTNRFFTQYTTNEVPWAGSGGSGDGSAKFEVQTATQSPGLGCGSPIKTSTGETEGAPCWLVAVPRGTKDAGEAGIINSGLFADAWKHRLAVRLEFRPTVVSCAIGAAERQLAGSELIVTAVNSWQPVLCGAKGGSAYSILTGSEEDAAAAANGTNPAPLALTSRPLDSEAGDSLSYAPIGLTGVAVSFAIDRQPLSSSSADSRSRARIPYKAMNLTPRLIAKLLTNSYYDSIPPGASRSHLDNKSGTPNPRNLLRDPDFLAINSGDDWKDQAIIAASVSDILVPQGRSDAATVLWSYVLSNPDAVAFLKGTPDPFGMIVNPWSSTTLSGTTDSPRGGLTYPIDSFPKPDPVEVPSEGEGRPSAINLVTWRPFTTDLDTGAYLTLRGDGQILGGWNPNAIPPKYDKATRNLPGTQRVIGLTDTASAAKYQTVTAALLNPAGSFVSPNTDSMTAAAAVMTAEATQSQVYRLDFASAGVKGAASAYPLTMPVYAAANPAMNDVDLRASYAAFIRYAVSAPAQTPGPSIGQLPDGYAPLPAGWRTQALAAATAIQTGVAPESTTTSSDFSDAPNVDDTGANSPQATGDPAGALAGVPTPKDPKLSGLQYSVPLSLAAGVAGALGVPLVSRLRRRL